MALSNAPEFGVLRLARIEPIQVREWVSALSGGGLSPSRIRQAYRLLDACLKAAVETATWPGRPGSA